MSDARRRAVVTGGGSGIGAAVARRLAASGQHVSIADINLEAATGVAAGIGAAGGSADAVRLDVGDAAEVAAGFDELLAREPTIDVLVNCAGVIVFERFEEFDAAVWERTFRINAIGTYLCIVAALPGLREAVAPAHVVNLASAAAIRPGPLSAPYNASKAAVVSITRSAAAALAPSIIVNAVSPGIIDTPMWDVQRAELERIGAGAGTSFEERTSALPIGRGGTPEEVAELIWFVASDANTYMVGANVGINGGMEMP